MKRLILLLALLAGTLTGKSQSGIGDLISMQFAKNGIYLVTDKTWHTFPNGAYAFVALGTVYIDSLRTLKNRTQPDAVWYGDTLVAGVVIPLQIDKIKLKKGKLLLYLNKQ